MGWVLVLALVLGALAAVLGNEYDVADRLGLPQWATGAATSLPALLTGLGALVLALLAGWLGGRAVHLLVSSDGIHGTKITNPLLERCLGTTSTWRAPTVVAALVEKWC